MLHQPFATFLYAFLKKIVKFVAKMHSPISISDEPITFPFSNSSRPICQWQTGTPCISLEFGYILKAVNPNQQLGLADDDGGRFYAFIGLARSS